MCLENLSLLCCTFLKKVLSNKTRLLGQLSSDEKFYSAKAVIIFLGNRSWVVPFCGVDFFYFFMKTFYLLLLCSFVFTPLSTFAYIDDGSGGCSMHGGINCSLGSDTDGSAFCNDGWADSIVPFDIVKSCKAELDKKSCDDLLYQGKVYSYLFSF